MEDGFPSTPASITRNDGHHLTTSPSVTLNDERRLVSSNLAPSSIDVNKESHKTDQHKLQKHQSLTNNDPGLAGVSSDWTLWQLLDSVFPTGGFAHSLGLEAAFQLGFVSDSDSLILFITSSLENAAALLLPFVFTTNRAPTLESWIRIDEILHATLSNQVARKASCALGSALLRTAATVYVDIDLLKKMKEHCRNSETLHCHHAAVFGVVTGLLAVDPLTSQRAFLFLSLRDCLSAATRLNLVGPLQAAAIQHELSSLAENILVKYANRPIEDAYQTAPLLDLVHGYHDSLLSRLFCS